MPEYSSTTITPADGVKTPAMNGSTSGNYTLADLRAFILASKGLANGLASLDANGKLTSSQLPDLADDVLVYGSYALLPSPGIAGKLYITADTNEMYRWDGTQYVVLSVDLSAYATKAEMEAADSDLKNALDANTKRIENLEEKAGDYTEVDVKSVYSVPTGKAKNMVLVGLRGVSRAENQLIEPTVFTTTIGGGVAVNSTAEGYFTLSGTASSADQYGIRQISLTIGHKYLIANCFAQRRNGGSWVANLNSTDMSADIFDTTGWNSGDVCTTYVYVLSGTTYNVSKKYYPIIRDLTQYFNGTIPSDADTIAKIQTNYPWLLTPSSYGTSMVKTRYEGFRSYDSSNNLIAEVTLPTPIELGSAGSVAEKAYLNEDGEAWKTNPIASVDLSTLSWGESGGIYYATLADMASDAEGICSNYVVTHKNAPDLASGEMNCGFNAGYLQIKTSSSPTGILYYELATPLPDTPLTPLLDNWIATEGGGTLEAVKTYPIDDSFTVGYLTL